MNKKDRILQKIIMIVQKLSPVSELYLFGSRAVGKPTKNSDWDLLLLLNLNEISIELEKIFMDCFYDLEIETGEVIAPLIYSKDIWYSKYSKTPLFDSIQENSIKLL